MSEPGEDLRPRQRALVDHFVRLGATSSVKSKAAIAAGYSEKGASQRATQELRKASVAAYLSYMLAEARKKAEEEGRLTPEQEAANRKAVSIKSAADRLRFYSRVIEAGETELEKGFKPNGEADMTVVRTGIAAAKRMDEIERVTKDDDEELRRLVNVGEMILKLGLKDKSGG